MDGGTAAALKIGGGLTNQFSLYYLSNAFAFNDGDTYVISTTGLGMAYYLSPKTETWYFHGALSLAEMASSSSDTYEG